MFYHHRHTLSLLASMTMSGVLFFLLTFLTVSSLASAPNVKSVKILTLNERLTVKGKGCQPQIRTQKEAKLLIRCVAARSQNSEPNSPDAKSTAVLKANDKLVVKRKNCRLQVSSLTNVKIVIVCDSGPLPLIIPDTTSILNNQTTQYLESISHDATIFTFSQPTDQLNALGPGEVIVGDISANAPDGFLRKVVSVTNNGGEVVVETQSATIDEAVQQAEVNLHQILQPSNLRQAKLAKGVTLIESPSATNTFTFQLNNVVLYDDDGDENTTNDQVFANGEFSVEPQFDFRIKVQNFELRELYFTTTAQQIAEFKLGSRVYVSNKFAQKELGEFPLQPITMLVGPLPVIITPALKLYAGIDGTISAGVSTGVTQTLTETAGLQYANGNWSPIQQFSNQFQNDAPSVSGGFSVKAYVGPKLELLLYGVIGPNMAINAYLKMDVNLIGDVWWKLYGGLEAPVGVSIEIFSHVVVGYSTTVIDYRIILMQSDAPPPTPTPTPTPTPIGTGNSTASIVAVGYDHTCAMTIGGGIKCWGYNGFGQFGNSTNTDSNIPIDVSGLGSGISAVAAGYDDTCALTTTNDVRCWGNNNSGQLGNGTNISSNVPVDVTGFGSDAKVITAGLYHTCGLTNGGGIKCWGYNGFGQLGNSTYTDSNVPVDVSGLGSGVSAITTGGYHTCALTSSGGVKCWGDNDSGQLGNGKNVYSNIPVDVTGLDSGVSAISAGHTHTCALTSGGGIKCWGRNSKGQLGNDTNTDSKIPIDVSGLGSGLSAITAGWEYTCALTTNNGAKCWGNNYWGQLGNGSNTNSNVPVDVIGLGGNLSAIRAGGQHTCGLTTTGGVKCWGNNYWGELGNGSNTNSNVPISVIGFGP